MLAADILQISNKIKTFTSAISSSYLWKQIIATNA